MKHTYPSLATLGREIKTQTNSSAALVEECLKQVLEKNGPMNGFITVCSDEALARAEEIDAAIAQGKDPGSLAGIPIAIKDNISTKGILTTCGSKILENYVPIFDATVVQKLTAAGAIVLGKTNMDEFAMGSSTENSFFGPTRNPLDPEKIPGGSSGGSAAVVGAGMAPVALGSDTGGSIRQPAACCGVVGIKPTYGRVSRYGLVAYGSSLDQIGPITTSVEDAALLLNVICGFDEMDATSSPEPVPDFTATLNKGVEGLRIGLPREYFAQGLDETVRARVMEAVDNLKAAGAQVVDISLPHTEYAVATYYIIATAEASSNLARYDGVKFGFRAKDVSTLKEMYRETRSQGFGAEVKRRIMLGTYVLSAGYYDAYYKKAQQVRTLITEDFTKAFSQCDCIVGPAMPTMPFNIGEKANDPLAMYLSDIYTISLNLAGLPGISVPFAREGDSMPVGVQVFGRAFDEATVLAVAQAMESSANP
ncbi:MAG: aspartyl/glutamyl-tRNA amidotransferase subunit A [Candidatus Raymondbacteria bacterium RifOxyA12_full_50_37]|nr:MAG: aspartyl/glutamyl-tRNA amidotransferase subunit A [Candidatus Raymondbacteria bacterium RifOxyA12_full_50_37]OGJ86209.1 MAG: aspartyl/glutamyl-tRNA amidotransferase subunit A [Candidatus Raymondbacteria bacterium RIFOXYA2_FULL_49_16]OGJ95747.1 MAG: aspartyl/glutamyl-tRNA amidotransferase subunit A [Candidatus Raymondbacteria bacterium RIFOXYC2_FULL_50_21]OGJ98021.1 MAG: aspartyl/glutamyl-tRNA amidotransferase subunit A [Candidatus Raymondbacteria bacterium RifOxyC12_full_50_8]OGJ98339.1